ncbi:helix-turn-helix domain-containing protein [Methylotenera sp.]|uniref:ArsR/SmtB family transcription factor n=1 Tax=Methylotenera sp. TaxID=2051956 RepID=UPI0024887333|nr:helix-turn-helix domain-containing protein [Methylotenera sp.]MDI1360526.1 helix-turn-helix domain-containing protein [Methylotenera sp.]
MIQFVHPNLEDISLASVLGALADPLRLRIVGNLLNKNDCMSCSEALPCPNMEKSTLMHHFRIMRETGLIPTEKVGLENRIVLRTFDIKMRFPGLLNEMMKYAIS